jgi:hypothetical protein
MVTVKWKALNFVRWGLGLLFIGVAVSRFVWPEKVVDTEIPPPVVASCKDVSRQTLVRLPLDTTTLKPPPRRMDYGIRGNAARHFTHAREYQHSYGLHI